MKTSQLEIQLERFDEEMIRRNLSEHTRRAYRADLGTFLDCFPAGVIAKIRLADIRLWLGTLYEKELSARTIRRQISALRTFFQFLSREGLIAGNPVRLLRVPKMGHALPAVLTVGQAGTLIDGVEAMEQRQPVRDLAICELLYGCGLRVSELVGLNLDDFDRAECWLLIRGKGKKERQVPYGSKAKAALERYLTYRAEYLTPGYRTPGRRRDSINSSKMVRYPVQRGSFRADPLQSALFLNHSRKRLSARRIGNIVKGYGLRVMGDGSIHPHSFRHAFATHLMDSGAGLREIQALLGHTSLSSTQIYTQVSIGDLMKAYISAHPKAGA